jgi:PEP-CTERM motif
MKHSLKMALVVTPLVMGVAAPAMATPVIEYEIKSGSSDSGLQTLPLTFDPISGAYTGSAFLQTGGSTNTPSSPNFVGVILDTVAVSSNSPGNDFLAELFGSTNRLINSGATATVTIFLGDNGFLAPSAPPAPGVTINNQGGGNVGAGTGSSNSPGGVANNTFSFFSCVNTANPTPPTSCTGAFDTTTEHPTVSTPNSGFMLQDVSVMPTLSGPYAITQEYSITIGAGNSGPGGTRNTLQFDDSTDLQPVPEPGTLFLLGASLLGLGIMRRRRKSA